MVNHRSRHVLVYLKLTHLELCHLFATAAPEVLFAGKMQRVPCTSPLKFVQAIANLSETGRYKGTHLADSC